ncbi:hypothetical protein [Natrinema zhouii]|nr:hypothetical protein [Natrinema zhouii]
MFITAHTVAEDPSEQPPRSFEHALRLLIPFDRVDVIEEATEDDA